MPANKSNLLTTGQAAKLCSVTPDAILKWIKKGQLRGVRTAGGHYRILYRDLQPHVVSPELAERPSPCVSGRRRRSLYCWEYFSNGGGIRDNCRQCVVYRVRAARCFLLADLKSDVGHVHQFCRNSCEDCVYYRRATGLPTSVLVLTSDSELVKRLSREQDKGISLRFAQNLSGALEIIHDFRPAFAAIDVERIPSRDTRLLDSVAFPQLPGPKIILVGPPAMTGWKRPRQKSAQIVGVLEKPFGIHNIAALIDQFLVDLPTLTVARKPRLEGSNDDRKTGAQIGTEFR